MPEQYSKPGLHPNAVAQFMVMLIVVPDISIPEVPNVKVLPVFMVIQPLPVVTSIPCHETFPPNPTVKPVLSEELFHCAMSPVPGGFRLSNSTRY